MLSHVEEQTPNSISIPMKVYLWDRGLLPQGTYNLKPENIDTPFKTISTEIERINGYCNFNFRFTNDINQNERLDVTRCYSSLSDEEKSRLYADVIQD